MKKQELREELAKLGLPVGGVKAELASRLQDYVDALSAKLSSDKKRKREYETSTHEELIIENLECPVCSDYITPPIYQCDSGHLLCANCRGKMTGTVRRCPVCRISMGKGRNLAVEKMVSKLKMKCPNSERGCDELLKYVKVNEHLKQCDYRDIFCTDPNCKWTGTFSGLKDHYLSSIKLNQGYHQITRGNFRRSGKVDKVTFRECFPRVLEEDQTIPDELYVNLYDTGVAEFVLQFQVLEEERNIIVSCFFVGAEADRKKYKWSIKFVGAKRDSHFELSTSSMPLPVCFNRWNFDNDYENTITCFLPFKCICECVNTNGDLPYVIEFTKLK